MIDIKAITPKILKSFYNKLCDVFAKKNHTHTKSEISDFPTSLPASDVSSWAKSSTKPLYDWSEINNKPSIPESVGYDTIDTIEELLENVQNNSPRMGSVYIPKDSRLPSNTWWNFFYIPHRTGTGMDNYNYGTLLLFPMTSNNHSYKIRSSKFGTVSSMEINITSTNIDQYAASKSHSHSYNDLSNKPTIPSIVNNLTTTTTGSALDAVQGKALNDKINSEAKNYGYVWTHVSNYFGIGFQHDKCTLDVSTDGSLYNAFLRSNYPIILYCILKPTYKAHHAAIIIIDSLLTQTKKTPSSLTSASQFRTLEGPSCFGSLSSWNITGNGATASNYNQYSNSSYPTSWGSTFWVSVMYNTIGYVSSDINQLFELAHYNKYSFSDKDQLNIRINSDSIVRDIYVLHPANISTVTFGAK